MISRATLALVMVVSCAHALVHVFEHALPSAEQEIAAEYVPDDLAVGKRQTGLLSTCWRVPWGLGALLAGWLVDRFGSERLLSVYLLGSAALSVAVAAWALPMNWLIAAMILMGSFASIYHPAGLALISHQTRADNRPMALGIHGVFGSAGTAASPFLAGLLLTAGYTWRNYYALLAVPAVALGLVFAWRSVSRQPIGEQTAPSPADDDSPDWWSFFLLTNLAVLQGFVYSALVSFLPRYLGGVSPYLSGEGLARGSGPLLTAGVLLLGCVGQFLAGTLARPRRLEQQLTLITLANVPFLLGMSLAAETWQRVVAAGLFATIHYMHQPIYNSLVAKYTPRRRRSLCYGFSFAMGLGVGGLGAFFAGFIGSDFVTYSSLAGVAMLSGFLGIVLWIRNQLL